MTTRTMTTRSGKRIPGTRQGTYRQARPRGHSQGWGLRHVAALQARLGDWLGSACGRFGS